MEVAIKTENLSKHYRTGFLTKRINALDNLNLVVETGQIFGFLGPNGAGKTTTIKILIGLIKPNQGQVLVLNRPPTDIRTKERVGFLPEAPYFYDHLTAEEFLNFCSAMHHKLKNNKEVVKTILKLVGLEKSKKVQLRHFSRGMLQRIGIAQALIADPELIILDEPMGGLDPIGRKEIRDVIINLKKQGKTIFFSTHILSDVELLCDQVGILLNGKLATVGTLNNILSESIETIEITIKGLNSDALARLKRNSIKTYLVEDKVVFSVPNEEEAQFLIEKAQSVNGKLVSLIPRRKTLEEHFIKEVAKG